MTGQWQELKETIIELRDNDGTGTQQEACKFLVNLIDVLEKQMSNSENQNKGKIKTGQWIRMSDLPEDKDDRYKCSRCGNVVHHSNGVNLYTFNSWCGRCGSLNNSLFARYER